MNGGKEQLSFRIIPPPRVFTRVRLMIRFSLQGIFIQATLTGHFSMPLSGTNALRRHRGSVEYLRRHRGSVEYLVNRLPPEPTPYVATEVALNI